jgi:hypothetical protein
VTYGFTAWEKEDMGIRRVGGQVGFVYQGANGLLSVFQEDCPALGSRPCIIPPNTRTQAFTCTLNVHRQPCCPMATPCWQRAPR